jgi:acetyltransferase-like isoleucine patch superfamily enzyme
MRTAGDGRLGQGKGDVANHHGVRAKAGASDVRIGRFTYGYEKLAVRQWDEGAALHIGSFCSISTNVTVFLGGNHRTDWISTYPFGHIYEDQLGPPVAGHPATRGDVRIGHDVWIAHGVTILSGVTIGDGAVLGATATVTRDVQPYEIVAGNPAQHVRYRFPEDVRALLLELRWWDLPLEVIRSLRDELCAPPDPPRLQALIARVRGEAGLAAPDRAGDIPRS